MEYDMGWFLTMLMVGIVSLYVFLQKANEWFLTRKLEGKQFALPPGDLGWPFIGNMWSFVKSYKYGDPEYFISSFASRYGHGGMYKTHMFGKPSIMLTTAETCKQVLMDDDHFWATLPKSVLDLVAKRIYEGISIHQIKLLKRITLSSIAGHEALSLYLEDIKDIAVATLDKAASMNEPIELLIEMRKYALQVIMSIILGTETDQKWFDTVHKEFSALCDGIYVLPVNLPGFAYHKAAKARDNLCEIFQLVVDERRVKNASGKSKAKRNLLDQLLECEDNEGRKFRDGGIVSIIILYSFGGFISTAITATLALIYLQQHPDFFQKAKEEQENILKRRSSAETGLSMNEIRQMKYLSKVINETLRLVNPSSILFREAKTTVHMNGYTIPKGWRVLTWTRNVHMDSSNYPNPKDFNPSRWDDHKRKPGVFAPFGIGHNMCPGAELARLEISVLLHCFILNYGVKLLNPNSRVQYFPTIKPADNCLARFKKLSAVNGRT